MHSVSRWVDIKIHVFHANFPLITAVAALLLVLIASAGRTHMHIHNEILSRPGSHQRLMAVMARALNACPARVARCRKLMRWGDKAFASNFFYRVRWSVVRCMCNRRRPAPKELALLPQSVRSLLSIQLVMKVRLRQHPSMSS